VQVSSAGLSAGAHPLPAAVAGAVSRQSRLPRNA